MREIKFRAHSKGEIGKKSFKYFTLQQLQHQVGFEYGFPENIPVGDDPELVYDQFTGLKDKNGKEIYEGDIITDPGRVWDSPREIKLGFYEDHSSYKSQWGFPIWEDDLESIEIIGNIYQNPELLKK